jgi:thiazole tautomerase (transcriptional regulator TenI)
MEIHIISTGKQTKEILLQRLHKIHRYVHYIHLRERGWQANEYVEVTRALMEKGVDQRKIIINDRIDIAAATGVGGVQLASHSLDIAYVKKHHPGLRIGCSIHSKEEAVEKQQAGADYCLYGHVFPTASKPDLIPRGLEKLKDVVDSVQIPMIAIGGILPENINSVMRTGVQGIAVLSGILLATDEVAAAKNYHEKMGEGVPWI